MAVMKSCANTDCKYQDENAEGNCTLEEITLDNCGDCEQLDEEE